MTIPLPTSSAAARKQNCILLKAVFADLLFAALFAVVMLSVAGCTQSPAFSPAANRSIENQPVDIPLIVMIAGSTAALPMLQELTVEFQRQEPDALFDVRGGGSRFGEAAVRAGSVDLAISTLIIEPEDAPPAIVSSSTMSATDSPDSSLPISVTVQSSSVSAEFEVIRAPIALSGLALIVHRNNPVVDLTLEQIQTVYSGRVLLWSELLGDAAADPPTGGWQTEEILLISRDELSGARSLFDERVMTSERLSLTSIIAPTNAAVIESVAANESAIGYVDRAYIAQLLPNAPTDFQGGVDSIRVLAIDGLLPENDAISSRLYPLIYPLYILYRIPPQAVEDGLTAEQVNKFVQLISSEAGQEIVGRYHALVGQ